MSELNETDALQLLITLVDRAQLTRDPQMLRETPFRVELARSILERRYGPLPEGS